MQNRKKLTEAEIKANYDAFVKGLTELTHKYGIAVTSIGGVHICETEGGFQGLKYAADYTSGDLEAGWMDDYPWLYTEEELAKGREEAALG